MLAPQTSLSRCNRMATHFIRRLLANLDCRAFHKCKALRLTAALMLSITSCACMYHSVDYMSIECLSFVVGGVPFSACSGIRVYRLSERACYHAAWLRWLSLSAPAGTACSRVSASHDAYNSNADLCPCLTLACITGESRLGVLRRRQPARRRQRDQQLQGDQPQHHCAQRAAGARGGRSGLWHAPPCCTTETAQGRRCHGSSGGNGTVPGVLAGEDTTGDASVPRNRECSAKAPCSAVPVGWCQHYEHLQLQPAG